MVELVTIVNQWGSRFVEHAGPMLVQSGILIIVLAVLDRLLSRHIRASVRYYIWMLVLIKLVLSPHFSLPMSVGNWIHRPPASQGMTLLNAARDVPPATPDKPIAQTSTPAAKPIQTSQGPKHLVPDAAELTSVIRPGDGNPATVQLTWQGMALLAWLSGVVILGLGLGFRARSMYLVIRCAETPDDRLLHILADARGEMKIRSAIGLRLTRGISSPAVCSLWRPVILLPKALVERFPEDKIRTVIVHELCHIKRADPWINWAQTLIQIFYFYNPLVWLANACIRRVREQAVDEGVLVSLKGRLRCYSHTLIDIAEVVTLRPGLGVGLIGVAESKTQLNERIHIMLNKPIPKHTRLGILWLAVIVMLGIMILPMATARTRADNIELFEPVSDQVRNDMITEFEAMKATVLSTWQAGDINRFLSVYTPDIITLELDQGALIGKEMVRKERVEAWQQGVMLVDVTAQNQHFWICGDLIYAVRSVAVSMTVPDIPGMLTVFVNQLMIYQEQDDGSFKIKLEAVTRDQVPGQPSSFGSKSPYEAAVWKWKGESSDKGSNEDLYDEIRSLESEVPDLLVKHKYDSVSDYYAEDAMLLATENPLTRGRDAISKLIEKSVGESLSLVALDQDIVHIEGDGNMIYTVNLFTWGIKDPTSGDETTVPGMGVHVWQRQPDGSWKLFIDISSADV